VGHNQRSQPLNLVELAVQGRQQEFNNEFQALLMKYAEPAIEAEVAGIPQDTLLKYAEDPAEDEIDVDEDSDEEASVINQIEAAAQYLGGSICNYEGGVVDIDVVGIDNAKEFANFLDNFLPVEDYDCYEVVEQNCRCLKGENGEHDHPLSVTVDSEGHVDWSTVTNDMGTFQFMAYLSDDLIEGDDVLIDGDENMPDPSEENGEIFEVQKVVKINFKGKKIIRMKCQKGYKYDSRQHACVKRQEHDLFLRRRKAQLNMLRRVASKAAIKKKINHKSLRFLLNRKRLGIGY